MKKARLGAVARILGALALTGPVAAHAADWSDTFIGYRYGTRFTEPNIRDDIKKHVIQFGHASGYKLGQNFMNVDVLLSDRKDPAQGGETGATDVYLIYRHQLHLGKAFGRSFAFGPVKEVGITAGFDLSTKNTAFAPRKRMAVVGPTLKFDVPGFFDVSLLYTLERNHCGLAPCRLPQNHAEHTFDPYLIVNAAWGIPFELASIPMKFQGFANYITPKGRDYFNVETKSERLVRTSLMVDVGRMAWGAKNSLWVGVGYEYWQHKFGSHDKPGVNTRTPTLQAEWHF